MFVMLDQLPHIGGDGKQQSKRQHKAAASGVIVATASGVKAAA